MRRATTSSPSPQCRCVPPATVPLPIPAPKVPLPDCCRAMVGITMCATGLDHQLDRPRSWRTTPRFAVDSTHTHARQVHKTRHKDSSQQLDQPHRSPPNLVKPPSPAFKPLPMGLGAIGSAHATPVQRRAPATTGKPLVARAVASTPPGRPWLGGRRRWHSPCT